MIQFLRTSDSRASSFSQGSDPLSTPLAAQAISAPTDGAEIEELIDLSTPSSKGLVQVTSKPFNPEKHAAHTRKFLAVSALIILVLFYSALLTLLAINKITLNELSGLVAAFSGLQALTAVAFAFYFAKS